MNPGFKKQPLNVIGKELIKAGEAMKEISGAPGRFECLKELSIVNVNFTSCSTSCT